VRVAQWGCRWSKLRTASRARLVLSSTVVSTTTSALFPTSDPINIAAQCGQCLHGPSQLSAPPAPCAASLRWPLSPLPPTGDAVSPPLPATPVLAGPEMKAAGIHPAGCIPITCPEVIASGCPKHHPRSPSRVTNTCQNHIVCSCSRAVKAYENKTAATNAVYASDELGCLSM